MKHYTVKVGDRIVYSGVGFIQATDAYEKCMVDRSYACSKCKAKKFTVNSDKADEEIQRIKTEVDCPDMLLVHTKMGDQTMVECYGSIPNGFVTMTCED